jgi:hypothetical protein
VGALTGHCLCGNVSYRCDAEPLLTGLCHCEDCQHQTGTTFSIIAVVPTAALEIEGDSLAGYETIGKESGATRERKFCSNCGSPIATFMADMPDLVVLKAGTLDDRSSLRPTLEIYCDSAQPWLAAGDERKRFPGGLPA